ncbi:MAG: hypothetical protein IJ880_11690 [Bacilli bacterium]|nr:hypothetical protein [Bacilli bacterium]
MATIKSKAPYLYLIAYKAEMRNGYYEIMSSEIDSLVMHHMNNIFTEEDIQALSRNLRSKLWKELYEKLWGKQEGQYFGFGEGNLHVTILSITKLKDENNE